jgi:hypothetical protein
MKVSSHHLDLLRRQAVTHAHLVEGFDDALRQLVLARGLHDQRLAVGLEPSEVFARQRGRDGRGSDQ